MNILFFFLLTLLAEVLGTIGGFGSSLFFVSLGQFFFDFQTVLALTGLLHIFSNTSKIVLFRKHIDWKLTLWIGLSSVLMAIAGAFLTRALDLDYTKLVLGIFLVTFSIFFFAKPDFKLYPSLQNSIVGGGIAGFLAGFIGTGGAIRGLVLASFNLEKNLFVGTSAAIDFGVDLSRTLIYLDSNYLNKSLWWYIPFLIAVAFIGSYLGKIILNNISQEAFKKILLGLILIIGLMLIIKEVRGLTFPV
ncbi:MAG: sulfite exporter TauE/SafE family protein [Flammeovirgaceae bacterium]|nr:sulfite exporter TauE/SafE family protein [Flammeovirgaceae bacterium]